MISFPRRAIALLRSGSSLCARHGAAGKGACHVEDGAPLGDGAYQRTNPPLAAVVTLPP
ncbi:hypothetical protein L842_2240 [Mycobacterium intracellulare MIN_052511_1280]|nr:hypothetical protein L842_2240 [Mycobacterium intracellulare MIN_052511_1280]